MKKALVIGLASLTLLGLAGCEGDNVGDIRYGQFKKVGNIGGDGNGYHVLRDIETGCTYLEAKGDYSFAPYYGENGEVKGCGKKNVKEKYE